MKCKLLKRLHFTIKHKFTDIKQGNLTAFRVISLQKKLLIVRIICRIINNLMSDWLGKVFSTLCVFFPYISWCPPTSTSFLHLRLIWWNSLTSIQLFKLCTELSFQAMHGTFYSSYPAFHLFIYQAIFTTVDSYLSTSNWNAIIMVLMPIQIHQHAVSSFNAFNSIHLQGT